MSISEVRARTEVRAGSEVRAKSQVRAGSEVRARGEVSDPAEGNAACREHSRMVLAPVLALVVTAVAVAMYVTGPALIPAVWLAAGPLLASLVLSPRITALLAGWSVLLAAGLMLAMPTPIGVLASRLSVCLLLAGFAVVNSALRTAAQRRITQVRAVARVAQSAILPEVPATVTAGRLASRYVSASPEARVGGDLLEVVPGPGHPRWLIGDTRGKGLPAVRLASVAMTSFRDACAQPGLSLTEIVRVVDGSVSRAAGEEDFVTAVFAEFDPNGWLQLVVCGHPPPLRLSADGDLRALTPTAYATPLGLHPDIQSSTFTVNVGDRLVFYTDGLLDARDKAGQFFRLDDCLDALRHPDLEASADELLNRLLAHAKRKLNDDVALLLVEATAPEVWPGGHPAAGAGPGLTSAPEASPVILARATLPPPASVR